MDNPLVGIIMGSDSDLPILKETAEILEKLGIGYEMIVSSAHRTPERTMEYVKSAKARGLKVIIAAAGGAAHLPGVAAAYTVLPVIGVPIMGKSLAGTDSLYSIAQMPGGIPVATVAINGALNAGLLAAEIIGVYDEGIYEKLLEYRRKLAETVENKSKKLEKIGYEAYLKENSQEK